MTDANSSAALARSVVSIVSTRREDLKRKDKMPVAKSLALATVLILELMTWIDASVGVQPSGTEAGRRWL